MLFRSQLKRNSNFDKLYKLYGQGKGLGNGEVMLYYIITNAKLGGRSSKGVDLIVDDAQFEVKSVNVVGSGAEKVAKGFFLGSAIRGEVDIIRELVKLGEKINVSMNISTINTTTINTLRLKAPADLKVIEENYGKMCVEQ